MVVFEKIRVYVKKLRRFSSVTIFKISQVNLSNERERYIYNYKWQNETFFIKFFFYLELSIRVLFSTRIALKQKLSKKFLIKFLKIRSI